MSSTHAGETPATRTTKICSFLLPAGPRGYNHGNYTGGRFGRSIIGLVNKYRDIFLFVLIAGVLATAAGCSQPSAELYSQFQSGDPAQRVAAIVQAGERKDPSAVPYLVDRLTDPQRDVRFFAIVSLEKITGQRMGYQEWASPQERQQAVGRWRQWLEQRDPPTANPVASGVGQ